MRLSLVAAFDRDNGMGWQGGLPWHLPDDLKRFKQLTLGKPVIMGRRTWDSIGRPLPGRLNIVVTRQSHLDLPGCTVVNSLEEGLRVAEATGAEEACIIGGAALYGEALPCADTLHITRVDARLPADVRFPDIDWRKYECTEEEPHPADDRHPHAFAFQTWARIQP